MPRMRRTSRRRGRPGRMPAFVDRLLLTPQAVAAMADGLTQIATLPDPVGEMTDLRYRPSGIQVGRMRVPLGVVGIIYESRPNVTADAAGLCLKSGNATILRGGSEAIRSNRAIAACVHQGLAEAGLPEDAVQVIAHDRSRRRRPSDRRCRARRRHRAPRRQGPDRTDHEGRQGAGAEASRRRVPRVHRRHRRHRHGDSHRRQREDAALFAVQYDGDAARPHRHRGTRAAAAGGDLRQQRRRIARLRALARARSDDEDRHRGGLVYRVSRAHPRGARRPIRSTRRSRTSRSTGRSIPMRS